MSSQQRLWRAGQLIRGPAAGRLKHAAFTHGFDSPMDRSLAPERSDNPVSVVVERQRERNGRDDDHFEIVPGRRMSP
jgi:hypothetical protein